MADVLFTLSRSTYQQGGGQFSGLAGQEFYAGDLWLDETATIDVWSEVRHVGLTSLIRQRSRTNLSFRRTAEHIQLDGSDVSVLWFVKYGSLLLSTEAGTETLRPGSFAITHSTEPFVIECRSDAQPIHEVFHVAVPTNKLLASVPLERTTNFIGTSNLPELIIAENILTDVFESDEALSPESASRLIDTAFALIGSTIRNEPGSGYPRSVPERRQRDIARYIDLHLANPKLSTRMAATGLDISPRYLSTLMKASGTPFSSLMWQRRLERAKLLLSDPRALDTPVAQIAYELGFKSAAHFSRKFRRAYQMSPRECRTVDH